MTISTLPTTDAQTSMGPQSFSRSELAELSDEKGIAAWLVRERQALVEQWTPERGGRTWMHAYSGLLDTVVRRLFALSAERTAAKSPDESAPPIAGVAILAVGGYGQRLCAPHSDLDLTFLSARDDDPAILHQMFPLVMDVLLSGAKIRVGYAYRTLNDLRGDTLDHQTQTALLDARLVAGDAALFQQFQTSYYDHLHVADFLFRKEAERAKVRAKWGDSPYVVEPNVKEGVGGLRDVQSAAWMARVRFGKGGEALWRDLLRRKVITQADLHAFSDARELLLSVRCALHLLSGERRDVLTAQRQEEVAGRLALAPTNDDSGAASDLPDVERFMERYYAAAGSVERIANKVMTRCLDAPLSLGVGTGISSVRRSVAITDPAIAEADPLWPMKALSFCQEHRLELALPTDESIERYVAEGGVAATNLPDGSSGAGFAFTELLTQPGDCCATVRRMRRTTLLRTLLPELDRCMGLIPYDSSHSHTVGEHSIRVLGNLLYLRDSVAEGDRLLGPHVAILESLVSPLPLFLAALFHDIGKQWTHLLSGERAGHEEIGAERIPILCKRLGCPDNVTDQVCFLTRNHLLLARISRLRDLTQPATLREVVRAVGGDRERLRMLYLLTWADTNAVGPGVWTDMSARLLDELLARTEEAIESAWYQTEPPADAQVSDSRLETVRQRLQRQLMRETRHPLVDGAHFTPAAADIEAIQHHVHLMPAAYLLNTPPETIAMHVAMIERLRQSGGVVADIRTAPPGSAQTDLTVVTRDAPGLFARLTGALFASDVRLHRAQAFTRPLTEGSSELIVIDSLTVDHRERPLTAERRRTVEEALRIVLNEEQSVEQLVIQRRRGAGALSSDLILRSLQVDNATAPDYTLIDVETPDELGIAYRLASRFAEYGWDIHSARISTWGGNVRCAFYLTDGSGGKLDAEVVRERLAQFVAGAVTRR